MSSVQKDLDAAIPLVLKAQAALDGLDVKDFQNLKALKSPPADIEMTFTCALHLLAKVDPAVPIDKNGKLKTEKPWMTALALMKDPKAFLESLNSYKAKIDAD